MQTVGRAVVTGVVTTAAVSGYGLFIESTLTVLGGIVLGLLFFGIYLATEGRPEGD